MLEKHYKLTREMRLYEKIAIDDLSVDDITYYLKLRREYEDLQSQVGNLIPSMLEKIKEFLQQSQENLNQLSDVTANAFLINDSLEIIGELEADVQKLQKKCSHVLELVSRQQEGSLKKISMEEAACALEELKPEVSEEERQDASKGEPKMLVSPCTIKKIEEMVRPKGHGETEKVVKIANPRDSKNHPPAKANKEHSKR